MPCPPLARGAGSKLRSAMRPTPRHGHCCWDGPRGCGRSVRRSPRYGPTAPAQRRPEPEPAGAPQRAIDANRQSLLEAPATAAPRTEVLQERGGRPTASYTLPLWGAVLARGATPTECDRQSRGESEVRPRVYEQWVAETTAEGFALPLPVPHFLFTPPLKKKATNNSPRTDLVAGPREGVRPTPALSD